MSTDKKSPTLFEHLPVDIFLLIFDLIPLQQLAESFFGLNSYINSIIRSVLHKSLEIRNNNDDAINHLQLFPTLIGRLAIIKSDAVDLTSLINLRSLSLEHATHIQLNSIRPEYFPLLQILHIKNIDGPCDNKLKVLGDLLQVILSNGFPCLQIFTALDIGSVSFNETWTGSPNLRILNLPMVTSEDEQKFQARFSYVRQLTTYENSLIEIDTGLSRPAKKRHITDIENLRKLESEGKFILDNFYGEHQFDTNKIPPRFNNTTITPRPDIKGRSTIQGRILLQNEPYCHASFLIEITLPQEYPFKPPDITFLDPIYHPNISRSGVCCGCECGFRFSSAEVYRPTASLNNIITGIIETFNTPFSADYSHNPDYLAEYRDDYETFYEKALKCTLSYGRPRY